MSLEILIGIDRDGTFIEDRDKSFPGKLWPRTEDIRFIPGAIDGLKILRSIQNCKLISFSNQAGPARKQIPYRNIPSINQYIQKQLTKEGVPLDGFYFCAHVSPKYAEEKRKEGKEIDEQYVFECPHHKPRVGMLAQAADFFYKKPLEKIIIYTIGDRASDVETGLNAGGKGVFVSNNNEHQIVEGAKVDQLAALYGQHRVYQTHTMRMAAVKILEDIHSKSL